MAPQGPEQELFNQVLQRIIENGLSLDSLRRLCYASKSTATTVRGYLTQQNLKPLHVILVASVQEAAACSFYDQQHLCHNIAWLLGFPGPLQQVFDVATPGCQSLISELLQISNIPEGTADALVGHGCKVSYEQLLSEAKQPVQGIDVWLRAYKRLELPMPPGTPPVVAMLCHGQNCTGRPLAKQVTRKTLEDFMSFAMVANECYTSDVLQYLLSRNIMSFLSGDMVLELLTTAIKVQAIERVLALTQLAAAQQVTVGSLLPLLEMAMQSKLAFSVQDLCELPAARELTLADVSNLLQLAAQLKRPEAVEVLCGLPAARQMQGDDLYQHLMFVIQVQEQRWQCTKVFARGSHDKQVSALCQLPAARQLSACQAVQLLEAAMRSVNSAAFAAICRSRAVEQLDTRVVDDLLITALSAAVAGNDIWGVAALCRLSAAQHVSAAQAVGLLEAATQCDYGAAAVAAADRQVDDLDIDNVDDDNRHGDAARSVLEVMCRLPAAQQITAADTFHLLAMAAQATGREVSSSGYGPRVQGRAQTAKAAAIAALCNLPAARDIPAQQAEDVLAAVVECGTAGVLEAICKLPPLWRMTRKTVVRFLLKAVQSKDSSKVNVLCNLTAAVKLPAQQAMVLLEAAVESGSWEVVDAIAELPGVHSSTQEAVNSMLAAKRGENSPADIAAALLAGLPVEKQRGTAAVWSLMQAIAATWNRKQAIAAIKVGRSPYLTRAHVTRAQTFCGEQAANVILALISAHHVSHVELVKWLVIAVQLEPWMPQYQQAVAVLSATAADNMSAPEVHLILSNAIAAGQCAAMAVKGPYWCPDGYELGLKATANIVANLCKLQSAQQLSQHQVAQLLDQVQQWVTADWRLSCVGYASQLLPLLDLFGLPAAKGLSNNYRADICKALSGS